VCQATFEAYLEAAIIFARAAIHRLHEAAVKTKHETTLETYETTLVGHYG
jgi:hypothetical protein